MTAEASAESAERLKNSAVKEFFGEDGVPVDLKKGWAIYEQRRQARAKVGAPLPPGGCLLLGREAVVGGAVAEAHMKLAAGLRINPKAIKLRLKKDGGGKVNLVADVDAPTDWVIPVARLGSQAPQDAARTYIQSVLMHINVWFRTEVLKRLEASELIRPELQQRVIPWDDGQKG